MVGARNQKLNRLPQFLPEGLVVDTTWLDAHGYDRKLRDKYLASGWLHHVSRSLYARPAADLRPGATSKQPLEWQRVVTSLQLLMDSDITVGGRTALEEQGFAHYLPTGSREVHLYASVFPGWLATVPTNARLIQHKTERLFPATPGEGAMAYEPGMMILPLRQSIPERAVLQLLEELPNRESFEQVDALFSGLGTLRPARLQAQLELCRSIKVKRLFFVYADRHNHAWFKHLDRSRIDLGSGKRALVEHGRYYSKYRITVPEFLLKSEDDL